MCTEILHPIGVRKRLCVSVLGGKQSIYLFEIWKVFWHFWLFCKRNCNFEYRIRILCI